MSPVERSGTYDGVRYVVTDDGDGWYCREDVERVLGIDLGDVAVVERYYYVEEGEEIVEYVPSAALDDVVDSTVGGDLGTMRDVWVMAWYEDLTFHVKSGRANPSGSSALVAELESRIEAERAGSRPDVAAQNLQLKNAVDDLRDELADVREDVRGTASSMGLALDSLEDAVTFVDGMRLGLVLTSPNGSGMGAFANLFCDLRGVEDAMQRIHSRLEDLAGGDGHE